ncbi:MAG: hypothetical protein JJT85_01870 [Chromatiales bacterium]|nr:hypothetical protein [Chromatiales bacterium]
MNSINMIRTTAAVVALAVTGAAGAQSEQQRFPAQRTQAASCAEINWNQEMLQQHPGLIEACQEVVVAGGRTWARFAANFVRVEPDGVVIFSVRDRRDRSLEEVRLTPTEGQVAYIGNRPTPFRQLRTTDVISLYVPEGEYGFATQAGVAPAQVAAAAPARASSAPIAQQTAARREPLPARLPTTAGLLPWVAFAGVLSLLAGLGLTLRRKY